MRSDIEWRGSKYTFDSRVRHHQFIQDASTATGGGDLGPSPKEYLLSAIGACSGIDVVGLIRKTKLPMSLKVSAEAQTGQDHPKIFQEVQLVFEATGDQALKEPLLDAVKKSQTLYCGVSAMVNKACPISYKVRLNGEEIGSGKADFSTP